MYCYVESHFWFQRENIRFVMSSILVKKDGTINNLIPVSIAFFFFKRKKRAFTEIRGCLFSLYKFEFLFRQHVRSFLFNLCVSYSVFSIVTRFSIWSMALFILDVRTTFVDIFYKTWILYTTCTIDKSTTSLMFISKTETSNTSYDDHISIEFLFKSLPAVIWIYFVVMETYLSHLPWMTTDSSPLRTLAMNKRVPLEKSRKAARQVSEGMFPIRNSRP